MDTVNQLLIAAGIALIFILGNDARVFMAKGWSIQAYKVYWRFSEGKSGIVISHLKLFVALMIIPICLISFNQAIASESGWFKGGYFVAGIQYSDEPSVFCKKLGIGGKSNSNITAGQNIYTWGGDIDVSVGLYGSHHSCDISPDAKGYDKAGPMFLIQW